MISVDFYSDEESLSMTVQDHGDRIVCAGCSALTCTLAAFLEQLYDTGQIDKEPVLEVTSGDTQIYVEPGKMRHDVNIMFSAIEEGMRRMQEMYPNDIAVTRTMPTLD